MTDRKRIAVLGGGPGGLSAAYHLARQGRDDLEITVYTMGWRLGGKGAAGRNFERAERIEEHGIHLFGNFYPNTFGVMKEVQEVSYEDFIPSNLQVMTEWNDRTWELYPTRYAHVGAEPWEDPDPVNLTALPEKLVESLRAILDSGWQLRFSKLKHAVGLGEAPKQKPWPSLDAPPGVTFLSFFIEPFVKQLGEQVAATSGFSGEVLPPPPPGTPPRHPYPAALRAVMFVFRQLAKVSSRLRYQYQQVDALLAAFHGFQVDGIATRGIDAIDGWDHRQWLRDHGISEMTLNSAVVSAAPSICLQFPGGDSTKPPSMSAAAYLTFVLRQVMAGGNAFHFFKAGTGETVFLPWYRKAVELGVKFEFFHKITDVVPDAAGERIERVEFDIQAVGHDGHYEPLCEAKNGQVVWDANTPYDKLERGDEMRARGVNLESWWADWEPVGQKTIELGRDFDYVVMAVPVGAHHYMAPSLVEQGPPAGPAGHDWRAMVEGMETIPSQAVQIWLEPDMQRCGLPDSGLLYRGERYAGPSYTLPLNLWTDFSDLIPLENWQGTVPRTLVYWCGPLQDEGVAPFDDHEFPQRQRERIRASTAQDFRTLGNLFPGATLPSDPQCLDFDLLVTNPDEQGLQGELRLGTQHLRPNIDPNERYVLSKPGHIGFRRQAWESGFENMALAGDWIFTGINIGSFEGAVMSGKLASHALTAQPPLDEIWGYAFLRNREDGANVPIIAGLDAEAPPPHGADDPAPADGATEDGGEDDAEAPDAP